MHDEKSLTQPPAASLHRSTEHLYASAAQETGLPSRQPAVGSQTSVPLQTMPSSQRAFRAVWMHLSRPWLHESSVQAMPSSHEGGVPARQPSAASQTSSPLQKRPSSH